MERTVETSSFDGMALDLERKRLMLKTEPLNSVRRI